MQVGDAYDGALIIGAPSIIGTWAFDFFRDVAAAMTPALEVRVLDRLDDIGEKTEWSRVIYLTQCPSAPVISVIENEYMPVVAFLDNACDAVAYIRRASGGGAVLEALRRATSGAVANRALWQAKSAVVVRRGRAEPFRPFIQKVLDYLRLRIAADKLAAIMQKYSISQNSTLEESLKTIPFYAPAGEWTNELSSTDAATVDEVLKPLVQMALQEKFRPIRWSYRILLSGNSPNESAPIVAQVAGAARFIYYGPYLHLPPGTYRARFVAGFSKSAVGLPFTIDVSVGGSNCLAMARFRPKEQGISQGEFLLVHKLPQDAVEARLRTDEGEIDGQVGLAWVEFDYLGDEDIPLHKVT